MLDLERYLKILIFPTDDDGGSDSDVDQDDAETSSFAADKSTLSQKNDNVQCSDLALQRSDDNQEPTKEITIRMLHDNHSVDIDSSKKHMGEIKYRDWPTMWQTQSSCASLDFPGSPSQQFFEHGAPSLFHPRHLARKTDAFSSMYMGRLFSFLPNSTQENGGLYSQSVTLPSPFMLQLPDHMLASQVCMIQLLSLFYHKVRVMGI